MQKSYPQIGQTSERPHAKDTKGAKDAKKKAPVFFLASFA